MQLLNSHRWFFSLILILPLISAQAETSDAQDNIKIVSSYIFSEYKPEVPNDSLIVRAGIPGVFVVYKNQARFRMVRTGKSQKRFTSILSGLKNNDAVIRDPSALFDGQDIKVQQ